MKPQIKNFSPSALLTNFPIVIEGIDGHIYSGQNLRSALQAMRRGSWGVPARSLNAYMRQVAKRVYGWNKIVIRVNSERNFVDDLSRAGVIKIHTREPQ